MGINCYYIVDDLPYQNVMSVINQVLKFYEVALFIRL